VKPLQEQRRIEKIAKEIAAALLITKPYALNLAFGCGIDDQEESLGQLSAIAGVVCNLQNIF
jgi:hypothetical protein